MKTETKFEVNEMVWVIDEGKARELPINSIKITHYQDQRIEIEYYINKGTETNYKCLIIYEN